MDAAPRATVAERIRKEVLMTQGRRERRTEREEEENDRENERGERKNKRETIFALAVHSDGFCGHAKKGRDLLRITMV